MKSFEFKSIKTKLAFNIGICIAAICLCLSTLSIAMATHTIKTDLEESLTKIAQQSAETISEKIKNRYAYLQTFSNDLIFYDIVANSDKIIDRMAKVQEQGGFYDVMVSDTQGKAYSLKAKNIDISHRDYFKKAVSGVNCVSNPVSRSGDDTLVIVYSIPIRNGLGKIVGTVSIVTEALDLTDMISEISYGKSGYSFIINKEGQTVAHPVTDNVLQNTNHFDMVETDKSLRSLVKIEEKMVNGETGAGSYTYQNVKKHMGYAPIEGTDWSLGLTAPDNEIFDQLNSLITLMIIISVAAVIIGVAIALVIGESLKKPIQAAARHTDLLASGDFTSDVPEVFLNRKDELGSMAHSIKTLTDNMNELLHSIKTASEHVAVGAKQISDSSIQLSQGATEQASSIEQLTASIEEISSQTKQNADNAFNANKLAVSAQKYATEGNDKMKEMLLSMENINKSARNISKIIRVIDDIAFQTNILALNAAVEAARAGQHGKGFAVVAQEVRNLAARSANAAKETTDLINGSIAQVDDGTRIANDTADGLMKIVKQVTRVAELVNGISIASNEQNAGISQITQGINQVSQIVQENSATSEENASASEELSVQAQLLEEQVQRFKLKNDKIKKYTPTDRNETKDSNNSGSEANKMNISLDDGEFGKY
jgi:methyl-accepting chemotaxis protein